MGVREGLVNISYASEKWAKKTKKQKKNVSQTENFLSFSASFNSKIEPVDRPYIPYFRYFLHSISFLILYGSFPIPLIVYVAFFRSFLVDNIPLPLLPSPFWCTWTHTDTGNRSGFENRKIVLKEVWCERLWELSALLFCMFWNIIPVAFF